MDPNTAQLAISIGSVILGKLSLKSGCNGLTDEQSAQKITSEGVHLGGKFRISTRVSRERTLFVTVEIWTLILSEEV